MARFQVTKPQANMPIVPSQETRLSLKIAGIIFWGAVFTGMLVLILVIHYAEKDIQIRQAYQSLSLLHNLEKALLEETYNFNATANDKKLQTIIQKYMVSADFQAVDVYIGEHILTFGTIPENGISVEQSANQAVISELDLDKLRVITYFPSADSSLNTMRVNLVLVMGAISVLFGLIMNRILQSVLTRPFDNMIAIAKEYAAGHESIRFDYSKDDEFGFLGKFINLALDSSEKMREELVNAKDEAEAANRSKSAFLATMSHEIRTPMNAIIGFSTLALPLAENPKQRDYFRKINSSAETLLGLINDILDFSKIEADKLAVENTPFDLERVIENVCNLVSGKASEKGLEFLCSVPRSIPQGLMGDPLRLGQVLTNLITNAIKFTKHGEVILSAEPLEINGDSLMLRFCVNDTGIGMSEEQLGKLFMPFVQADISTTRKYGGTGLGLVICKRLIELMGGEIEVKSVLGEGTQFYFTLPLIRASLNKDPAVTQVHPDLANMRILVVDDNESARIIFCQMLKEMSFNVDCASSGEDAVNKLQIANKTSGPGSFDLVLMDWKMPQMDGVAATRHIQSDKSLEKPPVIIMATAHTREDVMKAADETVIQGILLKPVSHSDLFDAIMTSLGKNEYCKKEHEDTLSSLPDFSSEISGARILLVEDLMINQQVAMGFLTKWGFIVSIADNGAEALVALETESFDLVLMDIQMPEMDGYEATRRIRAQDKYKDLPIIAMSAHALSGDRQRFLSSGMNDYISKPIEPKQMHKALTRWVKKRANRLGCGHRAKVPMGIEGDNILLPDKIDGLNIIAGLKRCMGDKRQYIKLLGAFRREYKDSAALMKQLIIDGETEEGKNLAHAIKGIAGNLGAENVYKAASEIERALNSNNHAHRELASFKNEIELIIESLSVLEGTEGNHSLCILEGHADIQSFSTQLVQLKSLLESGSASASDSLPSISKALGGEFQYEYTILESQVDAFEYDEAILTLERIETLLTAN